ncbi:MAG: PQQ-binding-like beta-propeller repeat protein [Thermoguttaceae bacterium]|nr:PQQ-binding-like beta-propeller repeat protein [Thermoguttaceae bacterium]
MTIAYRIACTVRMLLCAKTIAAVLLWIGCLGASAHASDSWPEFLGPGGLGQIDSADAAQIPLHWSENENITWKVSVPGCGWSSPVIASGQIWMTTASEDGKTRSALCYDLKSGKKIHDILLFKVKEVEKCNRTNSFASPTPVIYGEHVFVHFGAVGTVCLERKSGREIWRRNDFVWLPFEGFGSSPTVYEPTASNPNKSNPNKPASNKTGQDAAKSLLILTCDGGDKQFMIALDCKTGKTVWKTDRSVNFHEDPLIIRKGFCSSTVLAFEGRDYLLSEASRAAYAYEPDTGREIWRFEFPCQAQTCTMRPRLWKDRVIVNSCFQKAVMFAIDMRSKGLVREDQIYWENGQNIAACPTPVVAGDYLYGPDGKGTIYCISLETGKTVWKKRIGGNHWASPLHGDGKVFFFDDKGKTTIVAADPKECRVLESNRLDSGCMGTPAVADGAMIIRTKTSLYRVEAGSR